MELSKLSKIEKKAAEAAFRNKIRKEYAQIKEHILSSDLVFQGEDWEENLSGSDSVWPVHAHLGYNSSDLWGHYIVPRSKGFEVVFYYQKNLNERGDRGEQCSFMFPLSKEEKISIKDAEVFIENQGCSESERTTTLAELWNL